MSSRQQQGDSQQPAAGMDGTDETNSIDPASPHRMCVENGQGNTYLHIV